jgi:GT2 family glycosyltransferase
MISSANPSVTILILNWNGRALLPETLPALDNLDYEGYRVVVADNGSTDDSIEYIDANFPEITIINLGENLGFSKGLNEAVRRLPLDEEILVLLNNDVTVRRSWLRHLVAPFTDPQVGITGGKLLYPDEKTIQHAGAELIYPTAFSHHFHYQEIDQGQADEPREVPYVTGASLAIRQTLVESQDLFDELFSPFYYEDVDLCYRIRAAGFQVRYVPESVAVHHEGHSFEGSAGPRLWTLNRNRLRFVIKHYSRNQFLDEFVPTELERLNQKPASINDLIILRQRFLESLLALPEIIVEHGGEKQQAPYQAGLIQLLEAVLSLEPTISPPNYESENQGKLLQLQHLTEPPFVSNKAVIGPAIVAFREMWNDVSTKWYVRAIMQQQDAFNELAAQLLIEQGLQTKAVASDMTRLADEIVSIKGMVNELRTGLAALDAAVAGIEIILEERKRDSSDEHRPD